jgi:inosose dehydratase
MSVQIGTNPIAWSNDDMQELGGETPLETCLAEAREAGYAGIEMGHKFPRDSARLRPILQQHGLALISGWYSSHLLERPVADELELLAAHRDLLLELGCKVMVYAEVSGCVHGNRGVPLSRRPKIPEGQRREFADRLTQIGEHLGERGIRLAYHHHMGTVIETPEDIERLMEDTGEAVGLLLDTGHLTYAGGDPVETIRRHGQRIVHVHCKDIRADRFETAKERDSSFLESVLDGVFTVPGDGSIDYASVFGALKDADYSGWLVVEAEQDPAKAHPLTYAKKGYQHVHDLAEKAGLEP